MLREAVQVGQQFRWTNASEGSSSGTAVVKRVLSDQEEGLSPQVRDYAALWIEAEGLSGTREQHNFTIVLGTDGKSYLEGQQVAIEILTPSSQ